MARKRQAFFTKREMKIMLNVNEYQNYVFMPNEIFADFTKAFTDLKVETEKGKTSTHIAYAYSYYFLANYMWRYAQYRHWDDEVGEINLNEGLIKQFLGFPAKSEQYTYLTKSKVGLLEKIGYIRKESDKPCDYWYEGEKYKEVIFIYESRYPEVYINNKNWKVAMPVKGFWRDAENERDGDETGTFYQIQDTHQIGIDTFIFCMTNPELGVEGFYLYCFLKFMTDRFENGYDCSNKKMAHLTGLSIDEVKNQIGSLERYNMITNDHKPYCLDKPKDKKCKANTYGILEYDQFAQNLIQMNVIPEQRKISKERYEREIGWANEREIDGNIVDTDTGEIIRPAKPKFSVNDIDISDMDDLPFEFH
ncbi:hypothetical protein [Paenibacillus aceris]|uniref:Replication protein n=1 Tax=Paenibacillus aceris TaxID=869555 RepID=A0ABS4I2R8_9BACL|nr:hypothetical protein [Paenibacillus aceris]MBP1965185.1 hypothetical protein [Paenibacillus aceris]NHW33165.1 hypothetical protein [Paenibacillus aceris]